ncbi:MAG: hypothetical protein IBJ10_04755 [Phycisphaerales bacterium]|nr:hypothetical protein [Phycisphaerales bacterium]
MQCRPFLAGAFALAGATLAGCAEPYVLHARLTDPVFQERAAAEFEPGMNLAEVESRLDALRQGPDQRLWYPPTPTRGPTLLARFFEPGGFWVRSEDALVQWVDLAFEFESNPQDAGATVRSIWMFRDKARYFQGGPAYGPRRPAMAPLRRWPAPPPPPVDPYQDAWPIRPAHLDERAPDR